MKLIIPIAGNENKFISHFKSSRHLIKIDGKYILQTIINNFDNKFIDEIIIVCKLKQYKEFNFKLKFKSKINKLTFIKLGKYTQNQIATIKYAEKLIKNNDEVLIINPDALFKISSKTIEKLKNKKIKNCSGTIFYYNQLEDNNFEKKEKILVKNNKVTKVFSNKININFSQNNTYVTAGIYYFKKWLDIKKFIKSNPKQMSKKNLTIISIFEFLLKSKIIIDSELIDFFIDLGSIKKIQEYFFWQKYFQVSIFKKPKVRFNNIQNIIPSAGEGNRHKKLGFKVPKPLINISGELMVLQSLKSLPLSKKVIFLFKDKTINKFKLKKLLSSKINNPKIIPIKRKTKGMAITVSKANKIIQNNKPLIISSCDFSCVLDEVKLKQLIQKYKPDAIIFTWRQYPFASESPNSHAYVKVKKNRIIEISEKKVISNDPDSDFAVTGMFYFKTGQLMKICTEDMVLKKITINGEYYTATSMNKLLQDDKKIYNFEVDQFISWSLPEHLLRYNYWEKMINNK